jgi:aspartyl-tRNA(Asn)/glutamyl-tRNA(Gln) amidotransferase subunit C
MAVTIEEAARIAALARLKFSESELSDYTYHLNDVLTYVEKLNELDTTNVEPLSHPVENVNVFREDVLRESVNTETALKNAPDEDGEFFRVPKVIG